MPSFSYIYYRLIILQQYQGATDLILSLSKYRSGVDINFKKLLAKPPSKSSAAKHASYLSLYKRLKDTCQAVEDGGDRLTEAIKRSLPNLAKSQVYSAYFILNFGLFSVYYTLLFKLIYMLYMYTNLILSFYSKNSLLVTNHNCDSCLLTVSIIVVYILDLGRRGALAKAEDARQLRTVRIYMCMCMM